MNKKHKGDIAEHAVAQKVIESGWNVLWPDSDACRYDLVAEKDGCFVRIQAKYVTAKNGHLEVNCRSSNNWSVKPYTRDEIDVMAVYEPDNRNVYFIPVDKINKKAFNLRVLKAKNNQAAKLHLAEEYLSFDKSICPKKI